MGKFMKAVKKRIARIVPAPEMLKLFNKQLKKVQCIVHRDVWKFNSLREVLFAAVAEHGDKTDALSFVPVLPLKTFGEKPIEALGEGDKQGECTLLLPTIIDVVDAPNEPYWLLTLGSKGVVRIKSMDISPIEKHALTASELVALALHEPYKYLTRKGKVAEASLCGKEHPRLYLQNDGTPVLGI